MPFWAAGISLIFNYYVPNTAVQLPNTSVQLCVFFTFNRAFLSVYIQHTHTAVSVPILQSASLDRYKLCGHKTTPQRNYIYCWREENRKKEPKTNNSTVKCKKQKRVEPPLPKEIWQTLRTKKTRSGQANQNATNEKRPPGTRIQLFVVPVAQTGSTCYVIKMFLVVGLWDAAGSTKTSQKRNGFIIHPRTKQGLFHEDKKREVWKKNNNERKQLVLDSHYVLRYTRWTSMRPAWCYNKQHYWLSTFLCLRLKLAAD